MTDQDRPRQGMSTGAKIAIGCLVVFAAGCGLIVWKLGPMAKGFGSVISSSIAMQSEFQEVLEVSEEDAMAEVDLSLSLLSILGDPEGARGKWVLLQGEVVDFDSADNPMAGQQGGGFFIGEVNESEDTFRVLMVMTFDQEGLPSPGTTVSVLGKVFEAQPFYDMVSLIPDADVQDMGDMVMLMLGAKTWEAVEP